MREEKAIRILQRSLATAKATTLTERMLVIRRYRPLRQAMRGLIRGRQTSTDVLKRI